MDMSAVYFIFLFSGSLAKDVRSCSDQVLPDNQIGSRLE